MLYVIVGIIIIIILLVVVSYNSLVVLKNKVKEEWSRIEIQLKRRFDLIPNLLETVKGYAKHEEQTLKGIIEARNKFTTAQSPEQEIKASNELTSCMSKLFALSESYPDLKANTNFLDLQANLKETEDKISTSRELYNNSVLSLNNKIETFPSNIIASIFKFKQETFFESKEEEKEVPKIRF